MSSENILLLTLAIEAMIMFGLGLAYTSWTSRHATEGPPATDRFVPAYQPSRPPADTTPKKAA